MKKIDAFREATVSLLTELRNAIEKGTVPYHVGLEMQDTIKKTMDNVIIKSKQQEVGKIMTTDIVETLPWIDYSEVCERIEEHAIAKGKAEGEAKGKAEGKAEIVRNLLALGFPVDAIQKASGLSLEEIEQLRSAN
jgi:predicted transposase/invertase (TIGR01784 family)